MRLRTLPVAKWTPHKTSEDNDLKEDEKSSKRTHGDKFQSIFYLRVYQMAKEGWDDKRISEYFEVSTTTFRKWIKKKKAFRQAYEEGKRKSVQNFSEYVYDRLSPKMQEVWDKIKEFDDHPNALQKITKLMQSHGVRQRQHLYIQALISGNFNPTKALNKVGMDYATLRKWIDTDPYFSELLNEIEFHRKNFYEDSLFALVRDGNPSATIFVNRTKNKDRGYGTKLEVEHTGTINHNVQVIDLEKYNLPLELRRQILEHIEQVDIKGLPAPKPRPTDDVLDVPFSVLSEEEDDLL